MGIKSVIFLFIANQINCVLGSARSGYFWHVTDFHYDPTYWTSQLSCNDAVPKPGVFGDYWCDSNWRLINESITSMARIKNDVDFVIWTGDTVAHISNKDTTLEKNLEILKNITDLLKSSFPSGTKFLPSLGNHDFFPSDQADVKKDEMYTRTANIWKGWIPDDIQLEQFMKGGYFSMPVGKNLLLLSLNTNLYYTSNQLTKGMDDPAGQFAWMDTVLDKARQDGQKVIVTAHVTPGVLTPDYTTWMYLDHQHRYVGILTNYSDIILATHYGHDHSDGFKIMQEQIGSSKAVAQFVAPSVTPWRFKAGGKTGNPHNPGIRLVEYDKQTGQHINYVQYYINLTDSNTRNQANWTKLYDFKETYNVEDMSVKSLRTIFDKMKSDGGQTLAQVYCNNARVSKYRQRCTPRNRFEIVCGGNFFALDKANNCLNEYLVGGASMARFYTVYFITPILITFSIFSRSF